MVRLGFLSTYPPTLCGIASFTAALRGALPAGTAGGVVRLVDAPGGDRPDGVVGELVAGPAAGGMPTGGMPTGGTAARGGAAGCRDAAALLNREDVALVQHEYGIYGGRDGADVLRVLAGLTVPAVVVLHTVRTAPTAGQRAVLNGVVAAAAAVVVMTETARARLLAGYDVPADRVLVIPHGGTGTGIGIGIGIGTMPPPHGGPGRRPQVLTWGLLGPGKGIEWAIDAMALLGDLRPAPRYLVAGSTHPKVLARHGERYRESLRARALELGVGDRVRFDARYLRPDALCRLLAASAAVLLPYDSREQVTSGVLIDAVAARTPVVATRFPHAVELLSRGCGLLVNHRDPPAMAAALRTVLTDPAAAAGMAAAAGLVARDLSWASVAERYCRLAAGLARSTAPVLAG
jgi:glycosyltransferase involved in cell wall biosynthesis